MYKQIVPSLLFEKSHDGRATDVFPESDVPDRPLDTMIPADYQAQELPPLPEIAELDVVSHYTNLSTLKILIKTSRPCKVCSASFTTCNRSSPRSLVFPRSASSPPPEPRGS